MIAIKKDFVLENTISYCNNRPLSSGKAYYLKDNNGHIHYAGKVCAENHTNTDLTSIPDLTKALINNIAGNGGGNGGHGGGGNTVTNKVLAIEYLVLREEKLVNYPFIQGYAFNNLTNLYTSYITNNDLTAQEVRTVLQYIDNSVNNFNTKLSLRNLATCYAYDYILPRALSHVNNTTYIEGLLKHLKNKCTLTTAQIQGLQGWLDNLPQMQDCHLRAFN